MTAGAAARALVLLGGKTGGSGSGLGPQLPAIRRAPLGAFPPPILYPTTLPFTPPVGRDLSFYRANFCGLHFADAPDVPGCNHDHPETVMSCLLDNYPEAFQHRYLQAYAEAGYTHLQRSLGHALGYGHTLDQFIALTHRAQREYGLFSDVWFIANEFPGFQWNADASYWGPILDPYIDRLLDAGAINLACPSWQMDQVMGGAPGNATISIIAHVAKKLPASIPVYTHWMNEALAWWKKVGTAPDGADIGEVWSDEYQTIEVHDRFSWWYAMRYYLTGGHHQGSNIMAVTDPKLYQDKLLDTLDYFGGDTGKGDMGQSLRNGETPFALTAWEVTAQFQFDGQTPELDGDGAGYLMMCTTSHTGLPMAGYGNGARRPDGTPL